jgi:hypothetical protein
VLPDQTDVAVQNRAGAKTLPASADGVVSELVETDGSGPRLIAAG